MRFHLHLFDGVLAFGDAIRKIYSDGFGIARVWTFHVGTGLHNRINASARMVLNINRDSMADVGFSPPTRVFEAAGAGACLITDKWRGIEKFFDPEREILVAGDAEEIVALLRGKSATEAREIGNAMRVRALKEHTYAQRAAEVEKNLSDARADRHPSAVDLAVLDIAEKGICVQKDRESH